MFTQEKKPPTTVLPSATEKHTFVGQCLDHINITQSQMNIYRAGQAGGFIMPLTVGLTF